MSNCFDNYCLQWRKLSFYLLTCNKFKLMTRTERTFELLNERTSENEKICLCHIRTTKAQISLYVLFYFIRSCCLHYVDRDKRIWSLSPMRAAKVQASLRIRAVSPEPPLLAHTSSEPRGTFRQKARSLAPLNGWACAVKICHDGMLEDTNSLDGAHV